MDFEPCQEPGCPNHASAGEPYRLGVDHAGRVVFAIPWTCPAGHHYAVPEPIR